MMCLFRKCDEQIIETKEYPSLIDRLKAAAATRFTIDNPKHSELTVERVTTIKCNACGRIRIDQRSV
jgi:hypothetical protein